MSLSTASIHRPVFTIMMTLIVIILGGVALSRLPVDLMPDITFPTVSIGTAYGKASPEEMEELVTRPIEEALSAVPGVQEVSSSSTEGQSNVRVTFAWGTDLDAASNDIRDRLDRITGRLPDDADRPILRKFDLAAFPILFLGVSGDMEPLELRRIIDEQVKYRIERVPGVASLDVWGGLSREIHVLLNGDKIKALGLSIDQVLARIQASNVNIPAGTIDRGNFEVTIRTPGEYTSVDEVRETVIATIGGVPIPLKEVATVSDAWQEVRRLVRVNGKPGIQVAISKQSGMNTVAVARAAMAEIDKINAEMPHIRLTPTMNSAKYIQRSISNVGDAAMSGGLLAIVVLLFFLREVRSTTVIATAIPISIIATFVLMYFGGFTLNVMTLGGLALGVGMLVDNAIVVLENIFRLRDSGMAPKEAAVQGTSEVTAAIIASTLTTVVVFLPLIFVRGISGVMFKQFALVITFALLCSMAVAMTVVPMLAARVLKAHTLTAVPHESIGHRLFRLTGRMFEAIEGGYKGLLHWSLNHRLIVASGCLAVLVGVLFLGRLIGSEMMPQTDEGEVRVNAEMEVGTRLDVTDAKFRDVEAIVQREVPEAEQIVTSVGGGGGPGGGGGGYTANIQVALKPKKDRTRSSEQVANDLRRKLSGIPGMTVRTRASQGFNPFSRGMQGSDRLQVEIRGHDFAVGEALAKEVKAVVEQVRSVTDARISRESGAPEELVLVDRRKAADMKLTVQQIASMLETVLSGTTASQYREAGDEYAILVKLEGAEKKTLNEILDLTITNSANEQVVLRNVVRVAPRSGPVRVDRKNQERIVTVSANLSGERDMGAVIGDVREGLKAVPVPRDFAIVFGGDYEEQQKAFRDLLLSLALALVLVYMVMACQYESLRDPFVVMFSVPFAAIGVVLMLFLTGTTFNIQSYIGCIMLGGIVVNNAILLVDHTNLLRRRDGMRVRNAIEEAGRRRLRPILMTAMTTMLGLLPLALGLGEGGEAQAPLARTVIGGLISSTLITLVFVPVVYSLFEHRAARREAKEAALARVGAEPVAEVAEVPTLEAAK